MLLSIKYEASTSVLLPNQSGQEEEEGSLSLNSLELILYSVNCFSILFFPLTKKLAS